MKVVEKYSSKLAIFHFPFPTQGGDAVALKGWVGGGGCRNEWKSDKNRTKQREREREEINKLPYFGLRCSIQRVTVVASL